MANQQFCLRWNNYQENLTRILDRLLQTEALVDVTLYVGGSSIRAHKTILSACSPYFEKMFMENTHPHPIVVLKDFSFSDIKGLLDFMYKGEVNVEQTKLGSFIKVAEMLEVRGLTGEKEEKKQQSTSRMKSDLPRNEEDSSVPSPPVKRRRRRSAESDGSSREDSNQSALSHHSQQPSDVPAYSSSPISKVPIVPPAASLSQKSLFPTTTKPSTSEPASLGSAYVQILPNTPDSDHALPAPPPLLPKPDPPEPDAASPADVKHETDDYDDDDLEVLDSYSEMEFKEGPIEDDGGHFLDPSSQDSSPLAQGSMIPMEDGGQGSSSDKKVEAARNIDNDISDDSDFDGDTGLKRRDSLSDESPDDPDPLQVTPTQTDTTPDVIDPPLMKSIPTVTAPALLHSFDTSPPLKDPSPIPLVQIPKPSLESSTVITDPHPQPSASALQALHSEPSLGVQGEDMDDEEKRTKINIVIDPLTKECFCPCCGKTFAHKGNLWRHLRIDHREYAENNYKTFWDD